MSQPKPKAQRAKKEDQYLDDQYHYRGLRKFSLQEFFDDLNMLGLLGWHMVHYESGVQNDKEGTRDYWYAVLERKALTSSRT